MSPQSPPEESGPPIHGPVKSFLEHLEDLRWVLIKSVVAVAIGCTASFSFAPEILKVLQYPMRFSGIKQPPDFLKVLGPMDAFSISLDLSLYTGLVAAAPLVVYFVVSYLLPALTKRERRVVVSTLGLGTLLFLTGVAFCYFLILPPTLALSLWFTRWLNLTVGFWTVESYVKFATRFILSMGIAFEFPVVVLLLVWFGVLNYAKLAKTRRYIIVLIFIIAAILTPTPDALSQILLAAPLVLMFEICIWIAWLMEWKRRRNEVV